MLNNDNDLISVKKNLFNKQKEVLYGNKKRKQDANQTVFISIFITEMKRELTTT